MSEDTILQVKNLKTTFHTSRGDVQAVRGVSFHVNRGEIVGLVGESGSGKSVTCMSMLRLVPDTAEIDRDSAVLFEGSDLTRIRGRQMRDIRGEKIAMIFQDPMSSLNPLIPVGKQVAEMIAIHHPEKSREERKKETLDLFRAVRIPEPEKRFSSYPHEFSGGMRQRIMIAMALANHPDLLIADEPTTALDVTIQDQILKQLRELRLIMEEARIDDLFDSPRHPYTLGLLNSIPSVKQDRSRRLKPIPGSPPDMTNPPRGCPFAPRCPYARRICAEALPEFTAIGTEHRSRCWLLDPEAPASNNPFRTESEGQN